jgi:hypothetical protein
MVTRRIHMLMGQSNAVGTRPKTELTDLRYDLTQTDVRQWTRLNGVNGSTTTSAMSIPANQSSLEPAFGYLLRNTAGEWPIIFRAAGSGYSLETTWNPSGAGNEWANAVAHLWACYEQAKTEFAGDTIEFGSLVWWNAEADVQTHAWALAFEANLRELITFFRREFGKNLPFIGMKLSTLCVPGGGFEDPNDLATIRTAFDTVGADTPNVAIVDCTPFDLVVETSPARTVHASADAMMDAGDAVFAAHQGLTAGTQHAKSARAFSSLLAAQTFATSAQTAAGNRSENPATGGFARRLGAGARDPWPVTPRSQVLKHPTQNVWYVPIDPGMVGLGLDLATGLRPVDLSWLVYA